MAEDEVRIRIPDDDAPSAPGETSAEIKAATERANAEAARARQETAQARAIIEQNQTNQLLTGISLVKAEAANARAAYREAMESGDFDKAAEAQEAIATAASRVHQLESIRDYQAQRPQQPADPVEAFAQGRTEATAAWIRQHPQYIRDQQKFARLQSGHYSAIAEGLTPDTPQYFARVEREIGLRKGEQQAVKRSNDPHTHVQGGSVYLPPGEAERSRDGSLTWQRHDVKAGRCSAEQVGSPIGLEEMARRKSFFLKQGAYDRLD